MSAKTPCKDHLGQEFPSVAAMAKAWGCSRSTLEGRLQRGWTLEQALTVSNTGTQPKIRHKKPIQDHLGNTWPSIPAMAEHYHITDKIYWARKRMLGWDLEKILTTPIQTQAANAKAVTDHEGREFPSISDMCRYWHIGLSTYRERRKRGWDVQSALTGERKMTEKVEIKPCQDHLGNQYRSKAEMCRAYGITRYCYQSRLDLGWSQEKALTGSPVINAVPCHDYKNREFPTLRDMANFLGLPPNALHANGKNNLQRKIITYWTDRKCGRFEIKNCVQFPWFRVKFKNKTVILHFEKILEEYHGHDFDPLPPTKIPNKRLQVIRNLKYPWYLVRLDGQTVVMNYWRLIKLNTSLNFGLTPPRDQK